MNKITLITNIPTPYRLPLWDALRKEVNLEVVCISKKEKNRQWNLKTKTNVSFLHSYHLFFSKRDWALHFTLPFSLFFTLVRQNSDVVLITGYDSYQYWEALLYAKAFRKKKIMWSGSTLLSSRSKSKIVNVLKSYFIRSFDSYYTYGTEATKYIESFGVTDDSIVTGINTVDTDYYKKHTSNHSEQNSIKKFLYVGQLIERKGLINTIKAFAKLDRKDWLLTIVGSGEDEAFLKLLVNNFELEKQIDFVGYKQKEEIIDYYSQSDVFLMPSYLEVWGLVLNEALASGLFCLSSKYAGATFDLIKDGINGYIVDPQNIDDMVEKIDKSFSVTFNKIDIKESFNVSYEEEARKIMQSVSKALI